MSILSTNSKMFLLDLQKTFKIQYFLNLKKKVSMHDRAGIEADEMLAGTIDDTV
jgi:hypothetical protein